MPLVAEKNIIRAIANKAIKKVFKGRAAGSPDEVLAEQLLTRSEASALRIPEWNDIDDVLNADLMGRKTSRKGILTDFRISQAKEGGTKVLPFHIQTDEFEIKHLPKGVNESWTAYRTRINITPFFPETPNIVDNRRGALFAKEPTVKVHDDVRPFLKDIGIHREDYRDVLDFISWRTHAYGMVAVLQDFRALPADVTERMTKGEAISLQEREERSLGQPVLGVFRERQVLDFQHDRADGQLLWIKLHSSFREAPTWDTAGGEVQVVRVVDRFSIKTWEIRETDGGKKVDELPEIQHFGVNSAGEPEVPVELVVPFMGPDGLGQSSVLLSVRADLSQARLLSDVMYSLYVHGLPIVKLTTWDKTGERAASLEWATTAFIQLQSAAAATGLETESLEYMQLEVEGTRLLIEMVDKLVDKANELANRTTPSAATDPVAMSGTAKQWDFKTGEEKALNEHIHAIQRASDAVLRRLSRALAARGMTTASVEELEKEASTSFDPSFQIGDPQLNVELHDSIMSIAKREKIPSLTGAALERIPRSVQNLTEDEAGEIAKEIEARGEEEPAPVPPPPIPAPARASSADEDEEE